MILKEKIIKTEFIVLFIKGFINNLLFLSFQLGIFYAMYWAFKEDVRIRKNAKSKKKINRT